MEINKTNLFEKAFLIAISFTIIGALLKISHIENASILLAIGVSSNLVYIIIGIYEVNNSSKIQSSQKILWSMGFLVFNFFVGLLYLSKRKNIV